MKDRKPKVRSEPALRRSSTTPDSANGDKECILDGDRTSIAALIFCLISAACMGWWLMAHAQRALDPSICGGELFAAKPPHFMNGTAAFLDGQKRLASQVGHGTVGRNGRLGTGTNCVSLDGEVRHPHALSLLPSSNRRPSYVIFDLMNTAVTEENGLRKIKTKHALRGRSSDRVYGAPTWEWLRFGFGINKGLPTYRKWGIGEGVEFSVIDATNSAILWQSAPEFINDSYMGNACVNISNVQFIMLKVTASKAAAGAHAVFEDPLLFSGHIPTATCRSRPPFMDSLMQYSQDAACVEQLFLGWPKNKNSEGSRCSNIWCPGIRGAASNEVNSFDTHELIWTTTVPSASARITIDFTVYRGFHRGGDL